MFALSRVDVYIAYYIEGFLYGVYSGIFAIYLQHQTPKRNTDKTQSILFHSICALYVLSGSLFLCDVAVLIWKSTKPGDSIRPISFIQTTLFACCDLVAQFILIYRCWIVWSRNIRVVIIPSILTVAFLVIWIASSKSTPADLTSAWLYAMTLTGVTLSLTVNALVMGLIVFRIFRVFRGVKANSDNKILYASGGTKLRRTILVLIESGMALFSIQLARLVVTSLWTDIAMRAYDIIVATHQMLNGIIPTIIVVRISMGLSFHDEKSMEEVATGSLHFASNHLNSVSEIGSTSIVGQDNREDDAGVQRSNDIDILEK